ncbi:DNA methylase [Methanofervidicoccus sp. A16]|uniref:DUF1156 domain-containing protein n=1 Tax=Methanofervidicoccus sp. A16 TaxID=2607662 RepID=UPI00118BFC1A|nr:DUF1156 domain-containing protein [Methanofervidicoccus sp. A16]AXI24738.1 DNA methylase [Methanofervidicoccus sp. A16]
MEDKRYIEKTFPIREVGEISAKEKNIRHGHISTLHIWWARRPLAVSRAVNYASLIPAPEDLLEEEKRRQFIIDLAKWENSLNMTYIDKGRRDILSANDGVPPKVLDPFGGGGAIPLEALRLGCEVHTLDYNPVATLILKCTLEYPQKYGSKVDKEEFVDRSVSPLVRDVEKWGNWVLEESKKEIGKFYPPDEDGYIPVGYIWARILPCQNPLCEAEIPLMRQFWLAKKSNKKVALYPYVEDGEVKFRIVGDGYEEWPEGFDPSKGTVSRAIVTCPVCGYTIDGNTTRRLFQEGKARERLVAVVLHKPGRSGKRYRIGTERDIEVFREAKRYLEEKRERLMEKWWMDPVPDEEMNQEDPNTVAGRGYGFKRWGDLFNSRQKLALITFTEKVRLAYEKMIEEGYEKEYAKAVASYLALGVSRLADYNSSLTVWAVAGEFIAHTFGRQALPMVWDYFELNPWSESTGDWNSSIDWIIKVLSHLTQIPPVKRQKKPIIPKISQTSATEIPYPDNYFDAVITDPPYYNNINYAELSDFFYVWLKRSVGDLYPDLFITPLTPKTKEIVVNPVRHKGEKEAKKFFEEMLKKAFKEISRVLKPNGIAVIVYTHKSTEGWETVIKSLLDSDLLVTMCWPIDTEMRARLIAKDSAALRSSIYIVCRKIERKNIGWLQEIKKELREHIPKKLDRLWNEGVRGADYFISAIGSGIEVFGKYKEIRDYEGNKIDISQMLEILRDMVTDYAVRRILHNGISQELSPLTRFYILWRWSYRESRVHYDDARKLAQSVGLSLEREWNRGFIKREKEYIRVLGPQDRKLNEIKVRDLIDEIHKALLLWRHNRKDELLELLENSRYLSNGVFYQVAQAISETLPIDSTEKRLLDGFLSGIDRLIREVEDIKEQKKLTDY